MRRPNLAPVILGSDFDGCQAMTSETGYDIAGVDQAYEMAIADHPELGKDMARAFTNRGGHHHLAPSEIVATPRPDLDSNRLRRITREVNGHRLKILCGQIGKPLLDNKPWPRPTAGFVEFWGRLMQARESGLVVPTAIISNGHTQFIEQWYEALDLPLPDCMVTADVLDAARPRLTPAEQAKPSRVLMRLAETMLSEVYRNMSLDRARTIYVGDDHIGDALFAHNTGAEFVHVDTCNAAPAWHEVGVKLGLEES